MIRTQVQLSEEQMRGLRELAAAEAVSISELVRRAVELLLGRSAGPSREELVRRAKSIIGRYSSGLSDVGRRHDAYFAEAIMQDDDVR